MPMYVLNITKLPSEILCAASLHAAEPQHQQETKIPTRVVSSGLNNPEIFARRRFSPM